MKVEISVKELMRLEKAVRADERFQTRLDMLQSVLGSRPADLSSGMVISGRYGNKDLDFSTKDNKSNKCCGCGREVSDDSDKECNCKESENTVEEKATDDCEPVGSVEFGDMVLGLNSNTKVGDIITVNFDKAPMECLVISADPGSVEVITYDLLPEYMPMNESSTNEGGYKGSDLCKKLNNEEFINRFGSNTRKLLATYQDGLLMHLPTEMQIFGTNKYGSKDETYTSQLEVMKNPRNRIAFLTDEDGDIWTRWYWLENKTDDYSTNFCGVTTAGDAYYHDASRALGVRLRFRLRIHEQ
jgi:hypothetical protein